MSDIWVVMEEEFEWAGVRAILTNEEAAIALARELSEREPSELFDFVIEKHTLDARGETVKKGEVEYDKKAGVKAERIGYAASLGSFVTTRGTEQ